jgi:integrase
MYEAKTWSCKFYVNGKQITRKTGEESQARARRKMNAWEANPQDAPNPVRDRLTFDQMAKDYVHDYTLNERKSLCAALDYLKRLTPTFTGMRAKAIRTPLIRAYIVKQKAAGYANATINRDMAALHRMFTLAFQTEKLLEMPYIPRLKETNVRKGFFPTEDHQTLQAAAPRWLALMSECAFRYGWRKGELLNLKRSQIDWVDRMIRLDVGETKNDDGRSVYMDDSLYKMMGDWEQDTKALEVEKGIEIVYVFHRNGRRIKDFRRLWRNVCEKTEGGYHLFHDYRRTAVKNMDDAGVPRPVARMISGHKTNAIFDRYSIVERGRMIEASKRSEVWRESQGRKQIEGQVIDITPGKTETKAEHDPQRVGSNT